MVAVPFHLFLAQLLRAQGEVLLRLEVLWNLEELAPHLENQGIESLDEKKLLQGVVGEGAPPEEGPYEFLQGVISELELPEVLEMGLWTYPYYRALVEAPLTLSHLLSPHLVKDQLLPQAESASQRWIESLPLPLEIRSQATELARTAWLRFRHGILKSMGHSPLSAVK